jgi:iron complex outermembrane receptor protein
LIAVIAAVPAVSAENTMLAAATQLPADIFGLGQIETVTITGTPLSEAISESTVSAEAIYRFNALTVDRAIDLTTGSVSGTTGGPRNERLFFIRGFDRFQSTLMVDGIRVYLPADNRLDIGFFPTATLSQIQVQKGYVSVLSGPGAMGGALNLVTRKPAQPFEYDARAGVALAGNGEYNGYNASLLVGGTTGRYYWQASGAITKTDHWRLSDDFVPTPTEDGGFRDHTDARNYSANVKFGWTANATDEYSLSYTGTWGKKNATLSTIDQIAQQRNWKWPYWDVQSVYFLSNTALGETAYVQTKLYYNGFRNGLVSYDNANYNSQTTARAFRSYYSDYAYGGSIEVGHDFGERDTLKAAFFYRKDSHTEWQQLYSPLFLEPEQENIEDTFSIAAENRLRVTERIDFVVGASYDWRHLIKAQDFTGANPGQYVNYPLADGNAANVQGAIIYNYSDTGHVHLSVSSRARFPTLFERFSTRFGASISNPSLKPERATNYEVGQGDTLFGGRLRVDYAAFYSDVDDALVNVPIDFCDTTSPVIPKNCTGANGQPGVRVIPPPSQTQNVGDGKYYGFELSFDGQVIDTVQVGARYTYVNRNIDAQSPANPPLPDTFHLTGVPYSQLFAYVTWDVTPRFRITPNVQLASDRWTNTTNGNAYFKTGSFTLWNLEAEFDITERIGLQIGARNLLDQNYQLVGGFPSEGRSFFLNLRIRS